MNKQKVGVFCLFVVLAAVSLRTLLLTPGTVGHNWDWSIPAPIKHLQYFGESLPFTWRNFSLGEPISLWLPSLPFNFFLTLPSFFGLGGDFISKFLIILTIVLSGMGMFLLVENMVSFTFASFLSGFFYAFSPFLFAELIGGAATQFFAYSLFPWLLYFVRRLNQEKKRFWLYLLLSTLTLSLITISLQVLVLASLTLGVYFLIQEKKLTYLKNLLFIYFFYFFLNLYWILPTIVEFSSIQTTLGGAPWFSYFTIQNLVPFLLEAFVNVGYTRPFFLATINEKILSIWFLIVYLGVIFILWRNLLNSKKEAVFWASVFLLSLILVTGGKEPAGDQVIWLYQNFPLMSLFRSPQHFIVLPTFTMAILLGLAFSSIKWKLLSKIIVISWLLFWLHPFFLLGDLGSQLLRNKKMEHLDVYRLSPGYQKVFKLLSADPQDFKILFLPMSGSPYYLQTEYQNEAQGGDPLVTYSFKDTLTTDTSYGTQGRQLALQLEKSFCERKANISLADVLGLMNMKYLILRKDVIPHFSDCKNWDWSGVYQFLLQTPGLTEVENGDQVILFQNSKFLPHFLVVTQVSTDQNLPDLTFQKINPTLYRVQIRNAQTPYFLVFSESFNRGWKIYPQEQFWSRWFAQPLFEEKHFKINTFANAWSIDKKGDYDLVVEYWPQRMFWLGSMLSLLFLVGLLAVVIKKSILR